MKWKLFIVCCLFFFSNMAQNPISGINISLAATMPADISEWATRMPPVSIQANIRTDSNRAVPGYVQEAKILVTIKNDGGKICGAYTPATAPDANINSLVKLYRGGEIEKLLGQTCKLIPGSYTLCVQFFGNPNGTQKAISEEVCKQFTVQENNAQNYTAPQNVSPADGKVFTGQEIKQPLTFRWTPIVPRPQGDVIYKLRVFEIRKGQSATEAMKSGFFLSEKEVINQTAYGPTIVVIWPIAADSKYGWYVEASDKQGKSLGSSGVTVFSIIITDPSAGCFKLDTAAYKVTCNGFDKTGTPIYTVTNLMLKNIGTNVGRTGLHNFPATNYITPSGFTVTNLLPASATNIAPGGSVNISFNIVGATGTTATFVVNSTIPDPGGNPLLFCDKSIGVTVDLPSCKCTTCDNINIGLGKDSIQFKPFGVIWWVGDNNHLYLNQPLTVGPWPSVKVLQVKTEVVDFYWYIEGDCKKCNNNDYYWGNLTNGTTTSAGFNVNGTGGTDGNGVPLPSSHEMDFISNSPAGSGFSGDLNLTMSLPPQTVLSCCKDCFRFCIRYSIVFLENGVCKTCSVVKCYEVKRQHQPSSLVTWPPVNECGDQPIINHGGVFATPSSNKIK